MREPKTSAFDRWFARPLEDREIKISMDGKGRWMDNVFIERLWRSLKYKEIYLREYETVIELCDGLSGWFDRGHKRRSGNAPRVSVCDGTEPMQSSSLQLPETA